MLHHIIVKFNETVSDKAALCEEIGQLYAGAAQIPGVHAVALKPNVINRANRYDLMIRLQMDAEALPAWDESDIHHRWKEHYGPMLEKKAIFDCDD